MRMINVGTIFKECSRCGFSWDSREQFLHDPKVQVVGYQASFDHLEGGLFLFNHACKTTLALAVKDFADLYCGAIFETRRKDTPECPQFCLNHDDLRPCPIQCECAFVREILQIVRQSEKAAADTAGA